MKEKGESLMVSVPTHRKPTHPGEMLLEEFLKPMKISQRKLSTILQIPYKRINEIINGKRDINPSIALRLSRAFSMSEDFWLNLQLRWDIYLTRQQEKSILRSIKPLNQIRKQAIAA
jgi:addiction module HigA family antidote